LVVPARLSAQQRADLTQALFTVHKRIFTGVPLQDFRRHVVEPPAEKTVIQLYFAANGELVGYCSFHRFRRQVQGRRAIVLRTEAGLVPDYRGRGETYGFGIMQAVVEKLRHPFTPVYYLGTLVHPSSYHLFCKYFPRLFPSPFCKTPPGMQNLARALADSFPDPPVNKSDPLIRAVGWRTIETAQEHALIQRGDRTDVTYFRSRNPGYTAGHGLVVVVPITLFNILGALFARLHEAASIAITGQQPDL